MKTNADLTYYAIKNGLVSSVPSSPVSKQTFSPPPIAPCRRRATASSNRSLRVLLIEDSAVCGACCWNT